MAAQPVRALSLWWVVIVTGISAMITSFPQVIAHAKASESLKKPLSVIVKTIWPGLPPFGATMDYRTDVPFITF